MDYEVEGVRPMDKYGSRKTLQGLRTM